MTGLRAIALAIAILLAVFVAALVAHTVTSSTSSATVYSVSQVVTGLRHQPRAWLGRTVVVAGKIAEARGSGLGPITQQDWLYPPAGDDVLIRLVPSDTNLHPVAFYTGPDLWITPHLPPQQHTVADDLYRLPLVGRFFPLPNDLYSFRTFRLRLLSHPGSPCFMVINPPLSPAGRLPRPVQRCDEAFLLAATP